MKKYKLTFAVWKYGSGWQPHNYGDHYITAETPEEAAAEWASNMMAIEAPNAKNFVEVIVWDEADEWLLKRKYIISM